MSVASSQPTSGTFSYIQLGLIAQGLLQYMPLSFRRVAWFNFHSHIRTACPQKPPSERVVSQAMRHTWPDSLSGSSQSTILKKFLASKTSPARCSSRDVLDSGHRRMKVSLSSSYILTSNSGAAESSQKLVELRDVELNVQAQARSHAVAGVNPVMVSAPNKADGGA